jgi:hypothetical protein
LADSRQCFRGWCKQHASLIVPYRTVNPMGSSNKIMLELKDMGFEMDFPAIKLKAACGEQVCRVLLFACDTVRNWLLVAAKEAVMVAGTPWYRHVAGGWGWGWGGG